MAQRLLEVESQPGEEIILHFRVSALSFVPEATRGHFRTAHKEMLLALRSLLDRAIERTEKTGKTKARRRTKIEVQ